MNDVAARLEGIRDQPVDVLGLMFDRAPSAVCAIRDGRVVYINAAAAALWAAPTVEAMLGRPAKDCFAHPRWIDREPSVAGKPSTLLLRRCDATTVEVGAMVLTTDPALGPDLHLLVLGGDQRDAPSEIDPNGLRTLHSITTDAPDHRSAIPSARPDGDGRTLRRVTEGLDRLTEMVVGSLDEGIAIVDRRACVLWANPAATRITGLRAGDSMRTLDLRTENDMDVFPYVMPGYSRPGAYVPAGEAPVDGRGPADHHDAESPADVLCRFYRGDGTATWMSVACAPLRDGAHGHAVVSMVDISERRLVAEKLLYAAGHDELTGLPSRSLLIERIGTALAGRPAGRLGALMFIDLDRLKLVNDTHGHLAGDEVLRVFAQRLRDNLRREDVIGRLGGDEFVVLVLGCRRADDIVAIADRLQGQLNEPMVITLDDVADEPIVVAVGASIGIVTVDDEDRRSPRRLLAEADSAMYRAKRAGRGRVVPDRPLTR